MKHMFAEKNTTDKLFDKLNSYPLNIKFTLEDNPSKFLDTKLSREKGTISTQVFNNSKTFSVHWGSKIPIR